MKTVRKVVLGALALAVVYLLQDLIIGIAWPLVVYAVVAKFPSEISAILMRAARARSIKTPLGEFEGTEDTERLVAAIEASSLASSGDAESDLERLDAADRSDRRADQARATSVEQRT